MLTALINENPKRYSESITLMQSDLDQLKKSFTALSDYTVALEQNFVNIKALQEITAVPSASLVGKEAVKAQREAT